MIVTEDLRKAGLLPGRDTNDSSADSGGSESRSLEAEECSEEQRAVELAKREGGRPA